MSSYETIGFETKGRVAIITLNRPDAANGLNALLARELAHSAGQCSSDPNIRAVVLTANGRFFCAGGDIKEMASHGDNVGPEIKSLADDLHKAISIFARMDAPLIIAVNGMAAGAGFSLAVSGDLVIASEKAGFMMAYTNAGLSPDGSSSYFLPRLIGLRRTQELMLLNRKLSADDAYDWGLINEVTHADDLLKRAMEIADQFTMGAMKSQSAVKKLLLISHENSLEDQMELEGQSIRDCAVSPDGREGISAFTEKRKPEFE